MKILFNLVFAADAFLYFCDLECKWVKKKGDNKN